MRVVDTIAGIRSRIADIRRGNGTIGFVATMGALHAGHAKLISQARQECRAAVVSIFVNPLQFDRPDDLERYPRTLDADVSLCEAHGVDIVFAPTVGEMYPEHPLCSVDVGSLGEHLCGKFRPGHFRGVATVVLKLLQIVQPDAAYFGEKDAQQLAVVRRLVSDFDVPVRIQPVPTVREPDGVAMSSRNARLSAEERLQAPLLFRALDEARRRIAGGVTEAAEIRRVASEMIPVRAGRSLEYFEVVDPDAFQPVDRIMAPVIVAGALWIGTTRLIDNVRCEPSQGLHS